MLKKKKTTASGKLVLVKSVRRHWTSGGCPLSADRSGTETAQPQNEILCSKGLGGRCPGQASGEENHKGIFFSAGLCVLTQALLASIIPNQNNFGITTVLTIPHDGGGGRYRGTESPRPHALGGVDEHAEGAGGGNYIG